MATNDGLNELRTEIRKKQRNAGNKISRMKTKAGVDIAHSKLDPRVDSSKIKRYTRTQLEALGRRLDGFNMRSTQYVPDAFGKPMRGDKWQAYKAKERRYNAKVAKDFSKVLNIFIPNTNETIGERMAKVTPDRRHMANPTVNTPYKPPKRKSTQLRDQKALDKLSRDMDRRLSKNQDERQLKKSRDTWVKASKVLNDPALAGSVAGLTPKQFGVLWSYTNFADITFLEYHLLKEQGEEEAEAFTTDIFNVKTAEARDLVGWAKTLNLGG